MNMWMWDVFPTLPHSSSPCTANRWQLSSVRAGTGSWALLAHTTKLSTNLRSSDCSARYCLLLWLLLESAAHRALTLAACDWSKNQDQNQDRVSDSSFCHHQRPVLHLADSSIYTSVSTTVSLGEMFKCTVIPLSQSHIVLLPRVIIRAPHVVSSAQTNALFLLVWKVFVQLQRTAVFLGGGSVFLNYLALKRSYIFVTILKIYNFDRQ